MMLRGALALGGGLWEIFEFLPDWYDKMPISNSTVETTQKFEEPHHDSIIHIVRCRVYIIPTKIS